MFSAISPFSPPSFRHWKNQNWSTFPRRDFAKWLLNCSFIRNLTSWSLNHQHRGVIKCPWNAFHHCDMVTYAETAGGSAGRELQSGKYLYTLVPHSFSTLSITLQTGKILISELIIYDQHIICLNLETEHRKAMQVSWAGWSVSGFTDILYTTTWRVRHLNVNKSRWLNKTIHIFL